MKIISNEAIPYHKAFDIKVSDLSIEKTAKKFKVSIDLVKLIVLDNYVRYKKQEVKGQKVFKF